MTDVEGRDLNRLLIEEGARILAEQGLAGLSLRKLAAACDTSTMTVYSRFGDKAGLLTAMHQEGFRHLARCLRLASVPADAAPDAASGPHPLAALALLAELGRAYRRAALESRNLYGLMFGTRPPGVDDATETGRSETYGLLVDGVRVALDAGALDGESEQIALHLWATVHGMVSLELAGRSPVPAQDAEAAYDRSLRLAVAPFIAPSLAVPAPYPDAPDVS